MNVIFCTGIGACFLLPAFALEWIILGKIDVWRRKGKPPKPHKEPSMLRVVLVFIALVAAMTYLLVMSKMLGCWVVLHWMKH